MLYYDRNLAMKGNMMLKKLSLLLVFALLLAALGPVLAQDGTSGEITVDYQAYYRPEQDAETAAISDSIAAEYMEMNPNATVNLLPDLPSGTSRTTWLASRIAAGEAPDIAWDQYGNRNRNMGDWWTALDEYLEMPNPYIPEGVPGHDRWIESFPDFVMNQTSAPDGHWYQVSLDWVETALFYNVAMFEEAGVEADWANWGEFVADMKTIQDSLGVEAFGVYHAATDWSTWRWMDSLFFSAVWHDKHEELRMDKYNELFSGPDWRDKELQWRSLNGEEIAKAVIDGKLDATDERMDTFLRISKEASEILPVDFMAITGLDDLMRLFLSEQLAVYWGGSWNNKEMARSATFDYGLAYLPPFTEADFAGAPGTTYRVGGPSSAGQYGIPADTAAGENFDLAIDYLMWMSAPQNFGRQANSFGGFIPMVAGTEVGPVLANFQAVAAMPARLFSDPGSRLTIEFGDDWSRIMQGYVLGATDDETTKAMLQEALMSGAQALCEQTEYEWCS
jgi:ABC-type glycerol-3-phosphate transport system substrate-binding protein